MSEARDNKTTALPADLQLPDYIAAMDAGDFAGARKLIRDVWHFVECREQLSFLLGLAGQAIKKTETDGNDAALQEWGEQHREAVVALLPSDTPTQKSKPPETPESGPCEEALPLFAKEERRESIDSQPRRPRTRETSKKQPQVQGGEKNREKEWRAADQAVFDAQSIDEILEAVARAIWIRRDRKGQFPTERIPSESKFAEWLEECDREDHRLAEEVLARMELRGSWVGLGSRPSRRGRKRRRRARLVILDVPREDVEPIYILAGEHVHKHWVELPDDERPAHPLGGFVRAWLKRPLPAPANRRKGGIVARDFLRRDLMSASAPMPVVELPSQPGEFVQTDLLADLLPDKRGTPVVLLALDSLQTIHERRLALELLLCLGPEQRDGTLWEVTLKVRDVQRDWMRWKQYRPRKEGLVLMNSIQGLRDFWVPINERGGGYFPFLFRGADGWGLDSALHWLVSIPATGKAGAWIDRPLMRGLGKSLLRMYVWLCLEWNYYGGKNGRLIRATRPSVKRNDQGYVLNAKGQIIIGRDRKPVRSTYHREAIRTGEREPNPAVVRYRPYDADGLTRGAGLGKMIEAGGSGRRKGHERARQAAEQLERLGACYIQRLGGGRHKFPWRISPPLLEKMNA